MLRSQGDKLIFPKWKPVRGRASGTAEKWFRTLLSDLKLRDESRGGRIVGMHAFRHTLMAKASNCTPPVVVTSITGHVGDESAVARGYSGELSLANKRTLLEKIRFDF